MKNFSSSEDALRSNGFSIISEGEMNDVYAGDAVDNKVCNNNADCHNNGKCGGNQVCSGNSWCHKNTTTQEA